MRATIFNREGQLPADGWFHIEVSGEQSLTEELALVVDGKAVDSMVNRFAQDREEAGDGWAGMLVDSDHLSHDMSHKTEAMGWLMEVENRGGELYGRIDLTDLGRQQADVQGRSTRRRVTKPVGRPYKRV